MQTQTCTSITAALNVDSSLCGIYNWTSGSIKATILLNLATLGSGAQSAVTALQNKIANNWQSVFTNFDTLYGVTGATMVPTTVGNNVAPNLSPNPSSPGGNNNNVCTDPNDPCSCTYVPSGYSCGGKSKKALAIGLGVGLGVGIPVIAVIIVVVYMFIKKRRGQQVTQPQEASSGAE